MQTAVAPSASALNASAPPRTPLSISTGTRPSTASAIAGQRVERRDRAVDLAAAVVGDEIAIQPRVDRAARVVGVEDALEHDRQLRALAQEGEVVPGERRARVDPTNAGPRRAPPERRAQSAGVARG